jgi:hypothetical protein
VQTALGLTALVLTAAILALGTAIVFPFEMDTIITLSRGTLVATHYGLYNTVCGIGILLGNLGTGWALDLARAGGFTAVPWILLIGVGALCALALHDLRRRGLLPAETPRPQGARPGAIESTPPPGTNRTPSDPRCTARDRAGESRGPAPGRSTNPGSHR